MNKRILSKKSINKLAKEFFKDEIDLKMRKYIFYSKLNKELSRRYDYIKVTTFNHCLSCDKAGKYEAFINIDHSAFYATIELLYINSKEIVEIKPNIKIGSLVQIVKFIEKLIEVLDEKTKSVIKKDKINKLIKNALNSKTIEVFLKLDIPYFIENSYREKINILLLFNNFVVRLGIKKDTYKEIYNHINSIINILKSIDSLNISSTLKKNHKFFKVEGSLNTPKNMKKNVTRKIAKKIVSIIFSFPIKSHARYNLDFNKLYYYLIDKYHGNVLLVDKILTWNIIIKSKFYEETFSLNYKDSQILFYYYQSYAYEPISYNSLIQIIDKSFKLLEKEDIELLKEKDLILARNKKLILDIENYFEKLNLKYLIDDSYVKKIKLIIKFKNFITEISINNKKYNLSKIERYILQLKKLDNKNIKLEFYSHTKYKDIDWF